MQNQCPQCGSINAPNTRFCSHCGLQFASARNPFSQKRKNSLSTPLIILIVVLGSCFLCGIIGAVKDAVTGKPKTETVSVSKSPVITPVAVTPTTAPTAQPFLDTAAQPKASSAVGVNETADLHQSADRKSKVLDVVPQNASVEVIEQRGAWFLVKTANSRGWMQGSKIRSEKSVGSLPSSTTVTKTIPPTPRVTSPKTETKTGHSGASAKCRDGSLSFSRNRRGTCSHHGGVSEWY